MKNMKKAVSFLLAFAMVFAMNFTTAFAAEAPESAVTPAVATSSEDDGIMPLVWNQIDVDIPAKSSSTLSGYNVPERYMAFESTGTTMSGGTTSGSYNVQVYNYGLFIASHAKPVDGQTYKKDHIDLESTGNSVGIKVTNNTNVDIHVCIVFYSWA